MTKHTVFRLDDETLQYLVLIGEFLEKKRKINVRYKGEISRTEVIRAMVKTFCEKNNVEPQIIEIRPGLDGPNPKHAQWIKDHSTKGDE